MFGPERDRELGVSRPVAPPFHPSSVYAIPDLDCLERISDGTDLGYIYARDNHPNGIALAARLAELECAAWGVVAGSGMGALTATMLAMLKAGDRIVASDQLYGRTSQWLGQELARFGVTTTWVDSSDLPAVRSALATPTRVLLVETISNPLLRVADIPRLAEAAHARDCALVVDNTFATPVLCRPIEYGADVSIESLTKLIGGHSDVTLGAAFGSDRNLRPQVALVASVWGMSPAPFDCWLTLRSLPTLALRVRSAAANAREVAEWLRHRPDVRLVAYPGLKDHPDFELAGRMLDGAPGNMVAFELQGGRSAVNRFIRKATGIPFCPSLGDTGTTCSYPAGTSHRYMNPAEKVRLGITDGLIRLSVGIEPLDAIIRELSRGV
ncbi:MAG: aminotransferase class I/II-fold pyridoxal phosphate-dependent enzyme [Gemmataceae bacterium]|nr:aminotransferase class I/II-fold pyridoxal phosphate-dependent enzyme [Gemmataceae bacterium]